MGAERFPQAAAAAGLEDVMAIRSGHCRAFTLIELLVVVAIVGVLAAILLPSMARARQQGISTSCKSNVRQLGVGMQMYHNEFGMYPAHQWRLGPNGQVRLRWFNVFAARLGRDKVQGCPAVADWIVGRNNSYGYNYKYLGSARVNPNSPTAPWECFPVRSVRCPGSTIAFGDSDGTGWKKPHVNNVDDVDMLGNHGYTLDPTFIPSHSLHSGDGTTIEPYAWRYYRSYISTRHRGGSNFCFADGHVEPLTPARVYRDNRFWNGLGAEDPERDPHVDYRYRDGEWRFPGI